MEGVEDWLDEKPVQNSDGHTVVLSGLSFRGERVSVFLSNATEDKALVELDADEAAKLTLRIMKSLGYRYPEGFAEFAGQIHERMEEHRGQLETEKLRYLRSVKLFGKGFDDLNEETQKAVDELIAQDKRFREMLDTSDQTVYAHP